MEELSLLQKKSSTAVRAILAMLSSYHTIVATQNLPSAVAYVEVLKEGKPDIGASFHLGGGYFATARHVVDGNQITRIGRSDLSEKTVIGQNGQPTYRTSFGGFDYKGPIKRFFHQDERVDVAILQLEGRIDVGMGYPANQLQPAVQLSKFTDVISEGELLMSDVLVLGFPCIPLATDAHVVAVKGEISVTFSNREDKKRHFVISGMARGGFSGGPVFMLGGPVLQNSSGNAIHTAGTVIGIVGNALLGTSRDSASAIPELGFMSAVSVETLRETVAHHGLNLTI